MSIYNIVFTDYPGREHDMYFLQNAEWLNQAIASYTVYPRQGRWKIYLCFTDTSSKIQMLCRHMKDDYATKEKAKTFASYFTRTSMKGSKTLSKQIDYNINFN